VAPFELWSPEHIAVLVLTFSVPLILGWWSRRDPEGRRARIVAIGFAAVLIVQLVLNLVLVGSDIKERWAEFLPLHLCHFALFACVDACITRRQLSFDLAYFWGLGGTLQGLITPGLKMGFPSVEFVLFFLGHSGIVACVIFLIVAFRMRPYWRSVVRAFVAILVYALVAGAFNVAFDTNYGFLCAKPETSTLFDFLGDWPWYLASAAGLCVIVFIVLYLPWAIANRRST
jgi:hypothetical integral membrane protein (TIGR02206 family)